MSRLLVRCGPDADAEDVRRWLATAIPSAEERVELMTAGPPGAPAVLGATRADWERELLGDGPMLTRLGPLHAAVDATLFYRQDLRRALGEAAAAAADDAELVLAAFARWGADAFARLEGEFAAVIRDERDGHVVAATDFAGTRALFHATTAGGIVIGSHVELVRDATGSRDAIDLGVVAAVAGGLWCHAPETVYRGVRELPAGHVLEWRPGGAPQVRPCWRPPVGPMERRVPLDEAAEELRALLVGAVRERLAPHGRTALSLSGGWDSSAVGAAARSALGAAADTLRPVSISYPPGDPGREDELIEQVLAHWGTRTHWLDVDAMGMFDDAATGAARRALPFAHAYEAWNRGLVAGARAVGARVMFDGLGGDQLFQLSDIVLADLFREGHWLELARQWRGRPGRGLGSLWQWAIAPNLPAGAARAVARWRRRPPPTPHLHRGPAFWMRRDFLAAHEVVARDERAAPAIPARPHARREITAYLLYPYFPRIVGTLRGFAAEAGVALRSPLFDARIVRFATTRHWSERTDRLETKRVLRRAMRGLLPDSFLAPRPRRTGITSGYFHRQLRAAGAPLVEAMLSRSVLAEVGMIDLDGVRRAWAFVQRHASDEVGLRLFFTLQAELWLRARLDPAPAP